jgi:hypothetical protein
MYVYECIIVHKELTKEVSFMMVKELGLQREYEFSPQEVTAIAYLLGRKKMEGWRVEKALRRVIPLLMRELSRNCRQCREFLKGYCQTLLELKALGGELPPKQVYLVHREGNYWEIGAYACCKGRMATRGYILHFPTFVESGGRRGVVARIRSLSFLPPALSKN